MGYSVSDVMEFVEENDVKFVKLAFTDIYGNQKNMNIVSSELSRAFREGIKFNATNIDGFGEHINTDLLFLFASIVCQIFLNPTLEIIITF